MHECQHIADASGATLFLEMVEQGIAPRVPVDGTRARTFSVQLAPVHLSRANPSFGAPVSIFMPGHIFGVLDAVPAFVAHWMEQIIHLVGGYRTRINNSPCEFAGLGVRLLAWEAVPSPVIIPPWLIP